MLILCVLFFTSYGILAGAEEAFDCDATPEEHCSNTSYKFSFPESEREINEQCPGLINHLECLNNIDVKCPDGVPVFPGNQYDSTRDLLDEICDTSTFLHKALSENIACIKTGIKKAEGVCRSGTSKLRDAYLNHRESAYGGKEYDYNDSIEDRMEIQKYRCLTEVQIFSCALDVINEECGAEAKSIVSEVIDRSLTLEESCDEKVLTDVIEFLEALKMPSPEKENMIAFIDAFKDRPKMLK